MLAANTFTHVDNDEDVPYLRTPLFEVNMRLFHSSPRYRNLVQHSCDVIKQYVRAIYKDYKKPHGMSGANAGIPWNIVAILINRGADDEYALCMINPQIVETEGSAVRRSNCGSIRLPEPISVRRYAQIQVKYYDTEGSLVTEYFEGLVAATVQHEIDHNKGILITDRAEKE